MSQITNSILTISFLLLSGFFSQIYAQNFKSEVVSFEYGDYFNTRAYADIGISIREHNDSSKIVFDIDSAFIHFSRINDGEAFDRIEKTGTRTHPIGYGTYRIEITRAGHDTIVIHGYHAVPDQQSWLTVNQEQGNRKIEYRVTNKQHFDREVYGLDTTRYDNGEIASIKGKLGSWYTEEYSFYESGALKKHITSTENGMRTTVAYFENGWIWYMSSSNLRHTLGYFKRFYPNGTLDLHSVYRTVENGISTSIPWTAMDSLGNYKIKNGNTLRSWRRKNDLSTRVNFYKNGLKNGKWHFYAQDCIKFDVAKKKKSRLGMQILIYKKGVLRKVKDYRDGELKSYRKYDKLGKLINKKGLWNKD